MKTRLLITPQIILVFVAFFSQRVSSQELKFDHYSVDQGLSQGNVWDIQQDSLGFIWVATEDGLNVYDGYKFTVFKNIPNDTTSLTNNNINSIAIDREGYIWVATREGLNRYDRDLNRFEQYLSDPDDPTTVGHNSISNVYRDSKNNIWVCTNRGLSLYQRETNNFRTFLHKNGDPGSLAGNYVRCVVVDKNNQLWVGTMQGLSLMKPDSKTFVNFHHEAGNENSLSSNQVMSLFADQSNNLWIGTFDNGLNKYNPSSNSFKRYLSDPQDPRRLMGPYVYNISESAEGDIWISNDGALCLYDKRKDSFRRYLPDLSDDFSINSTTVTDVFFDINQRMWVGTRFGGVNVYDKGKYIFPHLKHNSKNPNSLSANNVQGLDEDANGNIWIGVDGGGLNKHNPKTGDFTHHRHDPGNKNSLKSDKVLCVEVDQFGHVWSGMWEGGVTKFDPKTGRFTRYLHNPEDSRSLSDNNIFDFFIDDDGELWIATWGNGISKYNKDTDDFTQYVNDPDNPNSIGKSSVVCIEQDHEGHIWFGTEDAGLFRLDKASGILKNYKGGDQEGQLSSNGIYSIYEDSKNRLWIGTSGAGLNLFNRAEGTFSVYRESDGLPNDAIVGILEDDLNNLWLSTNKGLSKFNPDSLTFKNYSESDGLQGDQFNRWSYLKMSTGDLIFGGINGFNIFKPENIKDNQFVPPVYVTDFLLFNKSAKIGDGMLNKNIINTHEITLNHNQNFFSFEYTALNYRQSEKNQYKYILEGLDENWIDAGTERKVSYTNVDPGKYIFKVIGSNNNGVWNETGAVIKITIVPPFWQTWWFRAAVGFIIIGSVIGYMRYIRVKAKRQQRELQEIIEERTSEVKKQNEEILKRTELEKAQNWITHGLAFFSEIISKHKGSLDKLSNEILKNLVKYVDAQQGAMAIAIKEDPTDEHLKILAKFGVNSERFKSQRVEVGEGLMGAAYADKERKYLDNIPPNYLKISSGLGEVNPARLILLPLKTDDGEVLGVIELAFLNEVADLTLQFLDKVSSVIALNVHAASLAHKTHALLESSKEQTEELRAQEEEMRQNMEELEATQEELRRREEEYQRKIEELKAEVRKLRKSKAENI